MPARHDSQDIARPGRPKRSDEPSHPAKRGPRAGGAPLGAKEAPVIAPQRPVCDLLRHKLVSFE